MNSERQSIRNGKLNVTISKGPVLAFETVRYVCTPVPFGTQDYKFYSLSGPASTYLMISKILTFKLQKKNKLTF